MTLAPPDPFRLRPALPRVVRLSRKAVIVASTAGAVLIAATLGFAFRVPEKPVPELAPPPEQRATPPIVAEAPADYAAIPKLGPPLPGDLGGPILAARRAAEARPPAPPVQRPAPDPSLRERSEAHRSGLFFASRASGPPADEQAGSMRSEPVVARQAAQPGMNGQDDTAVLAAGNIIPAALLTGLQSDLPGAVVAQVTESVMDSRSGRVPLIAQGSRLIGRYESAIASGQTRLMLTWERVVLPDGRTIELGDMPATDVAGMTGLSDRTDRHWGAVLRSALVSTLLGVGTAVVAESDDALVRAVRYGTQDSINQTGRQLVQRSAAIAPTLTIRPGHPVRVLVTRDLVIPRS
ncbi:TrbI/VirB10 family protein [Sphingomonas sp. FW199]|uniref:TrbI/VirB10 family protein n=1 Tax=Sphingomonas sp. FW199 TaxID=3400217 RepID=UPI003CF41B50